METSDSEYFESADEAFDSEDEIKKNKPLGKSNLIIKSDIIKNVAKEDKVVDSHAKKKEEESFSINQNINNLENINTETRASSQLDKNEQNLKTDDKRIELCSNRNDDVKSSVGDKSHEQNKQIELHDKANAYIENENNTSSDLWNEEEGWGIECESVKEESSSKTVEDVVDSCKTDSNTHTKDVDVPTNTQPKSNEDNMWDNEDWDAWETVEEDKEEKEVEKSNTKSNIDIPSNSNQTWKSWGSWGVTSILSTASHSVSTLTNTVSQGLSTVLETGIGAPDPEELAKINKNEQKVLPPTENFNETVEGENKNLLGFGLSNIGSLVSEVSKLVESTGTKVISGGLDTLETIGKKTMEVIQDGDPGLKRKRAFLKLEGEKPVLSQVLRDAKEKAEEENKARQEKHFVKKVNYESIFDDHQGLVHLEALEMLSKQCDMKLQSLIQSNTGKALMEIQETLDQVKELCELPDEEEDEQFSLDEIKDKLKSAVEDLGVNITYDKLITMWEETENWLSSANLDICDENEIHQQAVETLAQLTATAVEQFHKAGELLLIKDHRSTADEADSLVQLTTTVTSLIGIVAAKFSDKMNSKATENVNKENINSLITNIFFEAANSSSYIQDAFQLLVPVLQIGAV